jgi:hypothetical protein
MSSEMNTDKEFDEMFGRMFNRGMNQGQQGNGNKGYDVSDDRLKEMNKNCRHGTLNLLLVLLSKDDFNEVVVWTVQK